MGSSDVSLAEQIRRRVDAGELPPERPPRLWIGFGSGEPCAACDHTIQPAQVMYEPDWDDKTYRLHTGCYGLWNGALIDRHLRMLAWRSVARLVTSSLE